MKQLLILTTLRFSVLGNAQTSIIAHKSHSGARFSFLISSNSNFGKIAPERMPNYKKQEIEKIEAPEYFESFQPVNDTTVVKLTTSAENKLVRIDTITKKKAETIEEVKQKHSNYPKESNSSVKSRNQKENNLVITSNPPRNSNPPSFLLVVLLVAVVGMLFFRLFFGSSKSRTLKTFAIVVFFILANAAMAQTPIIAHKSHAGSSTSFFIDPNSNFGEIYMPPAVYQEAVTENYVHWELLDDSTIVKQVMDSNQRIISIDYISNKEKLSIDYFKYQFDIEQEHIRDSMRYQEYLRQKDANKENGLPIVSYGNPNDKNPPSFLFIFGLVSAIGTIIFRIFFSRSTTTPVHV